MKKSLRKLKTRVGRVHRDVARPVDQLPEALRPQADSLPGNPWDVHTLEETLEQVGTLNDRQPRVVIVDKGHQGVEVPMEKITL